MTLSFFRRHRKAFMALMILAVIAMVGFGTFPNMWPKVQAWFGSGGVRTVVGSIGGREVRLGEAMDYYHNLARAGQISRVLAMMLEAKATTPEAKERLVHCTLGATAWPIVANSLSGERPSLTAVLSWLALYEEARAAGFDTTDAQVTERLKEAESLGLTSATLDRIVSDLAGGRRDRLYEALRTDMTLRAYIDFLAEALAGAVTPELRREFVRSDERIQVRLAVLKAADFTAQVKDPGEDVLRTQFEKYKAFLAGKSPDGFGYRIADRVGIEYLVADPKGFESQVQAKITDKDIQEYYESRKDPEFLVKEEKPADQKPSASPGPAPAQEAPAQAPPGPKGPVGQTGPAAPLPAAAAGKAPATDAAPALEFPAGVKPAEKKFRPLAGVRDEIRRLLVQEEARTAAREAIHALAAEVRSQKKPPDLRIYADGDRIRHVAVPGFHTEEDLAKVPGIGKAARGKVTMPAEAVALTELVGAEKAKLAVMEISEPYVGPDGEAYILRVTACQPNHEPASLEEARDRVLADIRLARAYEIARETGRKLLEAAQAKDLAEAAKAENIKTADSDWVPQEHLIPVPYAGQFFAFPASLPEVGSNRVVLNECFRMAAEGKKLTLVSLAEEQMVVVAQLLGRKPPREARFLLMRPLLAQQAGWQLGGAALRQALDLSAIQRRLSVVLSVPEDTHLPRGSRDVGDDDL